MWELINKVLVVLYIMSALTVVRHGYYLFQSLLASTDEQPLKYKLSNRALLFLCMSIAYLLSAIFVGITIK